MDSRRQTSTLSRRSDRTANTSKYQLFIRTEDNHEQRHIVQLEYVHFRKYVSSVTTVTTSRRQSIGHLARTQIGVTS